MNSFVFTSITSYQKDLNDKLKDINKNVNINKKRDNKKYIEIPVIAHDSEPPSITIEQYNGGIMNSISSMKKYKKNVDNKIDYIYKNIIKKKKYKKIPIIAHDSELPSIVMEEINSGRMNSTIHSFTKNIVNQLDKKTNKNLKSKQYIDIHIIEHNSEKPSISFEEIYGGKLNAIFQTSESNYKEKKEVSKKKQSDYLFKKKNFIEIPVIPHASQKPSIVFEEINSKKIKNINLYPYEEFNLNSEINIDNNKSHNQITVIEDKKICENECKLFCKNKLKKIKKYKEIPIIMHDSEKPSITFEEYNTGIPFFIRKKILFNYLD